MRRAALRNQHVSDAIAGPGHMDKLVVCDAGFPVPPDVGRIDQTVTANIPRLPDTLKTILTEPGVEKVIVADEAQKVGPRPFHMIEEPFVGTPIDIMSHVELKKLAREARAGVRTGEFTP